MSKIYAVRKGRHPGIYLTWPECQQEINGYPGAVYKSFSNESLAKEWLAGDNKRQTKDHAGGLNDPDIICIQMVVHAIMAISRGNMLSRPIRQLGRC